MDYVGENQIVCRFLIDMFYIEMCKVCFLTNQPTHLLELNMVLKVTRILRELKKKITTNEIANKIDELVRSKRGEYTMEEMADNIGSYRQYLYNLRRGKFELKISLLYELSRFFEFDFLGWLAGQDKHSGKTVLA